MIFFMSIFNVLRGFNNPNSSNQTLYRKHVSLLIMHEASFTMKYISTPTQCYAIFSNWRKKYATKMVPIDSISICLDSFSLEENHFSCLAMKYVMHLFPTVAVLIFRFCSFECLCIWCRISPISNQRIFNFHVCWINHCIATTNNLKKVVCKINIEFPTIGHSFLANSFYSLSLSEDK